MGRQEHRRVRPGGAERARPRLPRAGVVNEPPGNSLSADNERVAEPGDDLAAGLRRLLARIAEELDFNDVKGKAPYRLGMHDGLRFAEDAIVDVLRRHGHSAEAPGRGLDA